jgi:hypothetical protein
VIASAVGSSFVGRYDFDVLAARPSRAEVPVVDADPGSVVEDVDSGFCGAVVGFEAGAVVLEDRHGSRRLFPLTPSAFLLDGVVVTLRRPAVPNGGRPRRTASGSLSVGPHRALVARQSRIWVEGIQDAELIERIWGDDLRVEGVVVEPLSGIDALADAVAGFGPSAQRRLGVLVDHLVPGSKESRICAEVSGPYVLVTGHPYVDIWQAVRPAAAGIDAWPTIPPGQPWKAAVCAALGGTDPAQLWRDILARVNDYRDLETPLINAVERLIDHVTIDDPETPTGQHA